MHDAPLHYLDIGNQQRIAYRPSAGAAPGVLFLGGFHSNMDGRKATALQAFCRERGRAYVRFDYLGHGLSSGRFEDGDISLWLDNALTVFDRLTTGPQILIGSSMGAWIALLLALRRQTRIHALLGIASAVDFTEDLIWAKLDPGLRENLDQQGVIHQPSQYDDQAYPITRKLIEDGRRHLLLREQIPLTCPVKLLHGLADTDVPWQTSLRLLEALASPNAELRLCKQVAHRFSEPGELALIEESLQALL